MRAGDILGRLRAFVEKRERHCQSEDLNELVDGAVRLGLVDAHDAGIEVKIEPDPDMPRVTVDRIEIQQVLVNLMRNAAEAMMESRRRELTISIDQIDAGYLTVSVADTGPGLPAEVARRLFQPFVSTKQNGMGMGLNICRTIVETHSGRLWSDPNPGGGAIFRFRLPADGGMDARGA
jgi:two-component system sensor kinase FixL